MSDLFTELKRRNVFRVALLYLIAGWLILQIGDILFPALGVPEWGIKLVLGLLLLGFPLALIFSWAFEMTSEGLKREKDVDRSTSITGVTGRKINGLIAGLLVVAIGLLAFNTFRSPRSVQVAETADLGATDGGATSAPVVGGEEDRVVLPVDKSIAVLPFVNMSGDEENEYFSDGLAETLLHMLAQVKDLRVAARTSSFQFKGHTGDVDDIGKQLNVSTVLEGSVRKSQNTVRVTAQLINVTDGYHMWSGTYDRELDDVFAIQDEIALNVVEALKGELLGEPGTALSFSHTEDLQAYDAFLQGRKEQQTFTFDGLDRAAAHFEQALAIDPRYAMAHVALAENLMLKANTGVTDIELVDSEIRRHSNAALELNPELGEAYAMLGFLEGWDGNSQQAETSFKRAIELSPSYANTYLWAARNYRFEGRLNDAEQMVRTGVQVDPLSSHLQWELGRVKQWQRDYDESLQAYQRTIVIAPDNPNGYAGIAMAYRDRGDFVEAIRYNKLAGQRDPDDYEYSSDLSILYAILGDLERAGAWLEVSQQLGAGETMPIAAEATLRYLQGDREEAARISRDFLVSGQGNRHYAGFFMRQILANVDLAALPEAIRARKRFQDPNDPLLNDPPEVVDQGGFLGDALYALYMAMALREEGRVEDAERVITAVNEIVDSRTEDGQLMPGYLVVAASAYALADRQEDLLEVMRGWLSVPPVGLLLYPIFWRDGIQFESARDLPEFQAMLARFEELIEPMRVAAAEVEVTNEP